MKTVKELLAAKGQTVWGIHPDHTVYEALSLMAEKNIGALPVIEQDCLVGMFSERDYARSIILKDRRSKETRVREVMTRRVAVVHPDQTDEECMALMTEKRVRHLPVILDDKLIGIISIGDLVKSIISHQNFIIEQLEHYIMG